MTTGAAAHRILVTGATGQVGRELVRELAPLGEIVAPLRAELDMANAGLIASFVRAAKPRWIVNAAAYTAVDRAEAEPEVAFAINAEGVRALGEEARAVGAAVIHFSTDYVFEGRRAGSYVETDATGPLNVYGASKLAGEQALLAATDAALIFRTSWVYGAAGNNFLLTILRLARERERLRVVGDQHGAPTWSRDLARMTGHVMAECEARCGSGALPDAVAGAGGIYHAAGRGETTWAGFADEALQRMAEREPGAKLAEIVAIATAEYPAAAVRPMNSRLECEKLRRTFEWSMMDWRESLRAVLAEVETP